MRGRPTSEAELLLGGRTTPTTDRGKRLGDQGLPKTSSTRAGGAGSLPGSHHGSSTDLALLRGATAGGATDVPPAAPDRIPVGTVMRDLALAVQKAFASGLGDWHLQPLETASPAYQQRLLMGALGPEQLHLHHGECPRPRLLSAAQGWPPSPSSPSGTWPAAGGGMPGSTAAALVDQGWRAFGRPPPSLPSPPPEGTAAGRAHPPYLQPAAASGCAAADACRAVRAAGFPPARPAAPPLQGHGRSKSVRSCDRPAARPPAPAPALRAPPSPSPPPLQGCRRSKSSACTACCTTTAWDSSGKLPTPAPAHATETSSWRRSGRALRSCGRTPHRQADHAAPPALPPAPGDTPCGAA
jgi:hypothetical protein